MTPPKIDAILGKTYGDGVSLLDYATLVTKELAKEGCVGVFLCAHPDEPDRFRALFVAQVQPVLPTWLVFIARALAGEGEVVETREINARPQ